MIDDNMLIKKYCFKFVVFRPFFYKDATIWVKISLITSRILKRMLYYESLYLYSNFFHNKLIDNIEEKSLKKDK